MVPALVAAAGEGAARHFLDFFLANVSNANTRAAYARGVGHFLAWCDGGGLNELGAIQPIHVAAYVEGVGRELSAPTVKQRLAAIRMLFDWLVVHQVVPANPASTVRGPRHVVSKGKTPVLDAHEARQLLDSIALTTITGLRDRALKQLYPDKVEVVLGFYSLVRAHLLAYENPPNKDNRVDVWRLEEKLTDVNIALTAYRDALHGVATQLVFVSTDSDIALALAAIKEDRPSAEIGVVYPRRVPQGQPGRPPNEKLAEHAHPAPDSEKMKLRDFYLDGARERDATQDYPQSDSEAPFVCLRASAND